MYNIFNINNNKLYFIEIYRYIYKKNNFKIYSKFDIISAKKCIFWNIIYKIIIISKNKN